MKSALFKEMSYPLPKLMEDIDMGVIGLPDIQRPFVWKGSQVRDLFDSMYKGFPVGYLLFWANGAGNGHKQIGTNAKQKVPQVLIVDGQQRLTSLFAVLRAQTVLTADYKLERIEIAFRPKDGKFEVADAAVKKDPEFIANISEMWSKYSGSYSFIKDYMAKLKAYRELTAQEEESIPVAIDKLWDVQTYTFSALELSSNITEEQVAEVFVRINSKGVQLKQADFILTLMSVFWDEGRRDLETFCRQARVPPVSGPSPFNYFLAPDPDELLRVCVGVGFQRAVLKYVYSILRGKDLEKDEFSEERRAKQFEILKSAQEDVLNLQNWHEFLKSITVAGFRSAEMVTSRISLLYAYIMFLIGKRDFGISTYELRNLIARWFFMAALTQRYTGSSETQMEADFLKLRNIKTAEQFTATLDQIIRDEFTDDFWNITVPNGLATSTYRSPSLFAYYAALNVLGAKALFSKLTVYDLFDPALKANKKSTERHHLFPKNYLKKLGITERAEVNQIGNFAVLEWSDNIAISDKSPIEYFPKYAARCLQHGAAEELSNMRFWHALPEGWEALPYAQFVELRRKLMAKVVRAGFEKLMRGVAALPRPAEQLSPGDVTQVRLDLDNPFAASGSRYKIFNILLDGEWHSIAAIQAHFSVDVRHRIERIKIRGEKTHEWRIEQEDDRARMIATPEEAIAFAEAEDEVEMSLKRQKQLKFWTEFKAFVEADGDLRCQTARPQAWLTHPLGRSGIYLASTVSPDLRAVLVVDSSDAKEQYATLEQRKPEIEAALGFELIWSNQSDRRRCQIYVKRDADLYDEQTWPEQFGWLKTHLEQLKQVFGPIVNSAESAMGASAGV